MEMQITIKGTSREITQQLNDLIGYYGKNATIGEIIENEVKISNPKSKKEEPKKEENKKEESKKKESNLDPIFDNILKNFFGL